MKRMINSKFLIALIAVCLQVMGYAQDRKPMTKDLTDPEIEISELVNFSIIKDLSLPDITYNGDEIFLLFGPDNKFVDTLYRKASSNNQDMQLNQNMLIGNLSNNTFRDPLAIELDWNQIKLGEYQISVRSKENRILHIRTFRLVTPQPKVDAVIFRNTINNNNFNTVDTLWINWDKTFTNGEVELVGDSLHQNFQSVFIGSREYEMIQNEEDPFKYSFGKKWESNDIFSLQLGYSDLIFERKYSSTLSSKKVFITAPKPKILGETIEFYVEEGESKTDINLDVENVFSGAKVLITPLKKSPNFPNSIGERPIEFSKNKGTISFPISFESIKNNEQKSFKVQIINSDNKRSDYKLINIIKKQTSVKMTPLESRKPLLTNFINSVKFEWLGGDYFTSADTNIFVLQFENMEPIQFKGVITDNKTLIANIKFPEKIITDKIKFTLLNGDDKSWNGEITDILKLPKVEINSNIIYKGGETHIRIENARNVELNPASYYNFISISKVKNENSKEYTIKANQNAENFDIEVKLLDHVVQTINYKVVDYPTLDNVDIKEIVDNDFLKTNDIIVIDSEENKKLTLSIPIDGVTITNESKFYAQIYRKDGTPIGEKREFIKNNGGDKFMTSLNTQRGLSAGDEFNIEISNPNDNVKTYKSYVERRDSDKWIITAGLSLVDTRITKNNKEVPNNTSVLDGVNIGCYYMLENYKNPSLRLIGFGPNISLTGNDNKIVTRIGCSALILEKLVIGFSYGQKDLGLLLGVNIQLADLSTLLGK